MYKNNTRFHCMQDDESQWERCHSLEHPPRNVTILIICAETAGILKTNFSQLVERLLYFFSDFDDLGICCEAQHF